MNPSKVSIPKINYSKRLDLEYSNPSSKSHCVARIPDKKYKVGKYSVAYALEVHLLSVGKEHSRSDLVFKQLRLRNNFIFRMFYWLFFQTSSTRTRHLSTQQSYIFLKVPSSITSQLETVKRTVLT